METLDALSLWFLLEKWEANFQLILSDSRRGEGAERHAITALYRDHRAAWRGVGERSED